MTTLALHLSSAGCKPRSLHTFADGTGLCLLMHLLGSRGAFLAKTFISSKEPSSHEHTHDNPNFRGSPRLFNAGIESCVRPPFIIDSCHPREHSSISDVCLLLSPRLTQVQAMHYIHHTRYERLNQHQRYYIPTSGRTHAHHG